MTQNNCKECGFGSNCQHHEDLYSIDIGHTVVCCNPCGQVVYHGSKESVETYIRRESQPELDFGIVQKGD